MTAQIARRLERYQKIIEKTIERLASQLTKQQCDLLGVLVLAYHDRETFLRTLLRGYSGFILPTKQNKVRPRLQARDAEIVRLRDEEHTPFKNIGGLLMEKDRKWSDKNGKPLDINAIKMAYRRAKGTKR